MKNSYRKREEFGHQYWFKNGLYHRKNGPAIIYSHGTKLWYYEGKLHREDGPAIENGVYQTWYWHGKIHRVDGPAIIHDDGEKEWWKNGKKYRSKETWWNSLSEKDKVNVVFNGILQ